MKQSEDWFEGAGRMREVVEEEERGWEIVERGSGGNDDVGVA